MLAAHCQSLFGIPRWMVELGRIDIYLEVSMLSSHLALPRRGHLDQEFHIFSHLQKYHNSELAFDPSEPDAVNFQHALHSFSFSAKQTTPHLSTSTHKCVVSLFAIVEKRDGCSHQQWKPASTKKANVTNCGGCNDHILTMLGARFTCVWCFLISLQLLSFVHV